jgi:hypothetical protein
VGMGGAGFCWKTKAEGVVLETLLCFRGIRNDSVLAGKEGVDCVSDDYTLGPPQVAHVWAIFLGSLNFFCT